jgi:hypothetical protein
MVGAGSNKKYWWRCSRGHDWQTAVRNRALVGTACPLCVERGGKQVSGARTARQRQHAPSHAVRAAHRDSTALAAARRDESSAKAARLPSMRNGPPHVRRATALSTNRPRGK